jgi:nifR3 family TIM-barrel protein
MMIDQKIGEAAQPSIGTLSLDGRAILAPMSGVTDVGMRRIARRFGASLVVSEMVACDAYVEGGEEARLRAEGAGVDPHVVQLAGCDPHWMAQGARLAQDAGAAIVDINMGCPAKRVTGGWAGSALMRDLDHATALIAATVAAVTIPVTVKMRLGWDAGSINAPELARRAHDLGVPLVTVHGRTRQQFYKGQADWDAIAAVRAAFPGLLVVNGDIACIETARTALARSGADFVMVGRAATGRPWLVGDIADALAGRASRTPSPQVMAQAAIEHYDTLLSLYGREMGLRHARKHLAAYADEAHRLGGGLCGERRHALVTSTSPEAVITLLAEAFAACAETTFPGREAA